MSLEPDSNLYWDFKSPEPNKMARLGYNATDILISFVALQILAQRQKEAKEAKELKRKRSASLRESKRSVSSQ